MKKIVLMLIAIFSMCCLVACGGETTEKQTATGNKESDQQVVVDTSEADGTPAPTAEPEADVTPATEDPAPTQEPVVYEGIDMDSTLNGQDWLETFIGVIDEPKVVVFSDITGKKVIVEQDAEVTFNLDEDAMALFIPEGYADARVSTGIFTDSNKISIGTEYYKIFYLDPEKMREEMKGITDYCPAFLVMKGDERVILRFQLKIE